MERGEGREKASPHDNSCCRRCCVFLLRSHLLITKLLTLEGDTVSSPASIWILSLGIQLQHGRRLAVSHPPGEGEGDPAQQEESTLPRLFPHEDFG